MLLEEFMSSYLLVLNEELLNFFHQHILDTLKEFEDGVFSAASFTNVVERRSSF
jgi:hypothetical protein